MSYGMYPWKGRGSPSKTSGRKYLSPSHMGYLENSSRGIQERVPSSLRESGVPVNSVTRKTNVSQSSPCGPNPVQFTVPRNSIFFTSRVDSSRISLNIPETTSSSASRCPPRPLYFPNCSSLARPIRWVMRTAEPSGERM